MAAACMRSGRRGRYRFRRRHLLQVGRHGRRLLRLEPPQVRSAAPRLPALCLHRLAAAERGRDRRDLDPQADARRRQARASVEEQQAAARGLRDLGYTLGTETPQSAIIAVILPDQEAGGGAVAGAAGARPLREHGAPAGDARPAPSCCAARSAPNIRTSRSGRSSEMFAQAGQSSRRDCGLSRPAGAA